MNFFVNDPPQQQTPMQQPGVQDAQPPQQSGIRQAFGGLGKTFDFGLDLVKGISDMVDKRKRREMAQEQFEWKKVFSERQFQENVRQFGLEFALREFATRKGLELQQVQAAYQNLAQEQNLQRGELQFQREANDNEEYMRQGELTKSFLKGFSEVNRSVI